MKRKQETIPLNLPQLQNLVKRDPAGYKEEFLTQWRHFESSKAIFELNPAAIPAGFDDQITFISHLASFYPTYTSKFPETIIGLLSVHHQAMSPDLRKNMVQSLILMRNRKLMSQTSLLSLFFTLFRCNDKALRSLLHSHIVTDIKNANSKSKQNKLNKTLQNFMYLMLKDPSDIAAKKSLEVMIELYKKGVWDDAKTVNVISEACFSQLPKLVAPSLHFFLGTNDGVAGNDSDSDNDAPDVTSLRHSMTVNKKTKARKNQMEKAMASIRKKERSKRGAEKFNFSALHLINDPQGFTEHLFSRLKQVTAKNIFKFELRVIMISLISRMIGVHKLILLGFYEFLISYLKPHQRDVTLILAYLAQSAHELVPPDALEAVVRAIADNFIWSNCAAEVITAGMNSLREICVRSPLAMPEELLKSLMDDYKNHKEKGPMNAARSLLGLYREVNPEMLKKKDRGKAATVNFKTFKALSYGEVEVATGIDGSDLLDEEDADEVIDLQQVEPDVDGSDIEVNESELDDISDANSQESQGSDLDEVNDSDLELINDSDLEDVVESDDEEEKMVDPVLVPARKKQKLSSISTEKIFTDEDFAKMRELKIERDAAIQAGGRKLKNSEKQLFEEQEEYVDPSKIMAGVKRKDDYDARMDSIKSGREGRNKYGSRKGSEERSSTTNKEKSKKSKAFMMIVHKRSVTGKRTASLRDKQRSLRKHITKQKKNL